VCELAMIRKPIKNNAKQPRLVENVGWREWWSGAPRLLGTIGLFAEVPREDPGSITAPITRRRREIVHLKTPGFAARVHLDCPPRFRASVSG